jgi:hypothetical protein
MSKPAKPNIHRCTCGGRKFHNKRIVGGSVNGVGFGFYCRKCGKAHPETAKK